MNIRTWYFSRCWPMLLVGFLITPTGASTIVPSQRQDSTVRLEPNAHVSVVASEPEADFDRPDPVVLLANANSLRADGELVSRAPTPAAAHPAPVATNSEMDSHLPEPGPLSAILATLALAGFVLVRRLG